ncbi:MAG: SpoIVB peptidase, partial [Clostridia bacterium]|nr:SpoIVB peptidase [Clostridia bacterium]
FADVKVEGVADQLGVLRDRLLNHFTEAPTTTEYKTTLLETVCVGGYPIGIKLYADGVVIVGTEPVDTESGYINTAEKAGLKVGDVIKTINGEAVATNSRVSQLIEESCGSVVELQVLREGQLHTFSFNSEFSVSEGKYKAGIWVRDSSAGIGTVTFCTRDGYFASLGHAVCDIDTKDVVPISKGECTDVSITGYTKGVSGRAGELCGVLEGERTGDIYSNGDSGVYGRFDSPNETQAFPVAPTSTVRTGQAYIYTTLENGCVDKFAVEIVSLHPDAADNKNLVVEITDARLLENTGGIIQGMSGSPIIQNNMLVGAITHVLVDNPARGYGIYASTMLNNLAQYRTGEYN